ncbi:hypothetical protein PPERSA_13042 [Pseudocohnilembus persalinus]|uniref:Dynein heavy chain C-terminal domain-containing protein n=1 Tax=Pseudocohnilembus persalinus TaxID=266149 RepID=A0A0V0R257_PSEPJ|nr:hypothetical protein PPERSA_13042 [Pseudocohnilembus persalinus]|eukprot:KRX08561.1 hypothetical protein PPERSA_13042 [Pseudocohnilembus persalinus]
MFFKMHKANKERPKHEYKIEYSKQTHQFLQDLYKKNNKAQIFILNEVINQNSLLYLISQDLKMAIQYIKNYNQFSSNYQSQILDIVEDIKNNKIPQKWQENGFLTKKKSLSEYFKLLISKCEHTMMISILREGELYPQTSMHRLFDPFALILTLLQDYSLQNKVPLHHLKVKLNKLNYQNQSNLGIELNGIYIKAGAIYNKNSQTLEPEKSLDFESELPIAKIEIAQRNPDLINEDKNEILFEFNDIVHKDLELSYILQQQEKNEDLDKELLQMVLPVQEEEQQIQFGMGQQQLNYHKAKKKLELQQSLTIEFVKIPIINPWARSLQNCMQIKMYFIFKSSYSQDFWLQRGTEIYFGKIN